MHERLQITPPQKEDLGGLVQLCLKAERDMGLSEKSQKELTRYLNEFITYCKNQGVDSVKGFTPEFLKGYADQRGTGKGPDLKKAVVWSLRKFTKHLSLLQILEEDPARNLRHPKFHPRSELPEYLSAYQLRGLLEYGANSLELRDFVILSLLTTTGFRPNEIVTCKRDDFLPEQGSIYVHVKGGWIKQTPLSDTMCALLKKYLATRDDQCQSLFVNTRGRPVSVSWLQRIVKSAGKGAGLPFSLTCNHLRHTFATFAADKSGKVITKALMGHQRLSTTEIYTHLSPGHFKSIMELHPYANSIKKGAFHEHG